jgi:hypothetical protein
MISTGHRCGACGKVPINLPRPLRTGDDKAGEGTVLHTLAIGIGASPGAFGNDVTTL